MPNIFVSSPLSRQSSTGCYHKLITCFFYMIVSRLNGNLKAMLAMVTKISDDLCRTTTHLIMKVDCCPARIGYL